MGNQHALGVFDHTDSCHNARADVEFGAVAGERTQFEERRVLIDEQFDAFTCRQLAAGVMTLHVFGAAAGQGLGEFGVEFGQLGRHRRGSFGVGRRVRVDRDAHGMISSGMSTRRLRNHSPNPLACGSNLPW